MENVKLVMVNGTNNNNKFYNMVDNGDGTFTAHWGRVGQAGRRKDYSISQWYDKLNEKLRKGYSDVSEFQEERTVEVKSNIENSEVADLIGKLAGFAKSFISRNYRVSSESVTSSQVNRVQNLIAAMKGIAENKGSVRAFNRRMEDILTTIPRATMDVRSLLAKTEGDFADILEREQSVLNVMASKVKAQEVEVDGKGMLEAHGLTIKPVTKKEKDEIISHLDPSTRSHLKRAFKVVNKTTNDRFNEFCKKNDYKDNDIKFLYHGSRNQNWMGIIQQGLTLNNKAPKTGAMFSRGLYFAPNSNKSFNYLSLRGAYWNSETSDIGYMAVYRVAIKKPHNVYKHTSECHNFSQSDMDRRGCDGVWAHKGQSLRADEVIVYSEDRCDIKYILEMTL